MTCEPVQAFTLFSVQLQSSSDILAQKTDGNKPLPADGAGTPRSGRSLLHRTLYLQGTGAPSAVSGHKAPLQGHVFLLTPGYIFEAPLIIHGADGLWLPGAHH